MFVHGELWEPSPTAPRACRRGRRDRTARGLHTARPTRSRSRRCARDRAHLRSSSSSLIVAVLFAALEGPARVRARRRVPARPPRSAPRAPASSSSSRCIDRMVRIDLRTVTLNVPPQEVITRDNVTVRVNAVAYFRVVDPTAAVVEVEKFLARRARSPRPRCARCSARHELDELLAEREKINDEPPADHRRADRALGRQGLDRRGQGRRDARGHAARDGAAGRGRARAAREDDRRRGRVPGVAEARRRRAGASAEHPVTLQLRYLQTMLEMSAERTSTIIFPIPIDLIAHLKGARASDDGFTWTRLAVVASRSW